MLSRIRTDERVEQFEGASGPFLAEPAASQLQPLPRCHASVGKMSALLMTADAIPATYAGADCRSR